MRNKSKETPQIYSAKEIADYFVYLASQKNVDEGIAEGVTPLKLQKLLYFAQAVSLSLYNKRLFNEEIEAWKYGPVIASLYHEYKQHLNSALTHPSGEYKRIKDEEIKQLLTGVWELFGKYTAGELVEITHEHTPWKETYEEGANKIIPTEKIKIYYSGIFELQDNSNGE